jgi:hypothetical protein
MSNDAFQMTNQRQACKASLCIEQHSFYERVESFRKSIKGLID